MKTILPAILILSIILSACIASYNRAEMAVGATPDTYVILKSGEKIQNIVSKQSSLYNKTADITVGDRVIEPASIRWIKDTKGLWLLCRGTLYKCVVEGKLSVYHTNSSSSSVKGSPLNPVNYFLLVKGETILNRRMNYRNLADAMSDNQEALDMLDKIHRRVVKRDLMKDQLKVVEFYNR